MRTIKTMLMVVGMSPWLGCHLSPETENQDTPGVVAVYPTQTIVPENLLKFHLHFATGMKQGWARTHVELTDEEGTPISDALLEPIHELWDTSQRHLTVFLDPGRVKTGLTVHDTLGRALVSGRNYRLVVRPGWPTLDGKVLKTRFAHAFRAGPTDRNPPALKTWMVQSPQAKTRDPLTVRFPEAYDQACLAVFVRVLDAENRIIPGDIRLAKHDTEWTFVPRNPWSSKPHHIAVDPRLEDLAGNNLQEVFDHPISARASPKPSKKPRLAFVPREATLF